MDYPEAQRLIRALRKDSPFRRPEPHDNDGHPQEAAPPPAVLSDLGSDAALIAPAAAKASKYLPPADIDLLLKAFHFADSAHQGQMRDSGLPYITHPVAVCEICIEWKLDISSLLTALLHDVIEDQDVSKEELGRLFNEEIASLVDGLTKLDKLHFNSKAEQQAESFRKMLLAMSKDIRVILVKLADRLHNMRTLGDVRPDKAHRVARETIEIYAPIADRLGLHRVVREFQQLCFQGMHPYRYRVLEKALKNAQGNRRDVFSDILYKIRSALPAQGIEADLHARQKTLYSTHRKMVEQHKSFAQVMDIHAVRLVVNTEPECYLTLGILHKLYRPVPGKFKDYIALPKVNGYQSLHTTLIGPYGIMIECQIRTRSMHNMAEKGIVSHWMYKVKNAGLSDIQQQTHTWLESLLSIQDKTSDPKEFLEHVKIDLFPDAVFVLTPKGRVVQLPRGATPIDFAYAIHTDIGNRASFAKINHQAASLRDKLRSGDTVEIITSPHAQPRQEWIEFVRTGRARSQIRNFLRNHNYQNSVNFGKRLLNLAIKNLNAEVPPDDSPLWDQLLKNANAQSLDQIFLDIGLGNRLATLVARRLLADDGLLSTTAAVIDNQSTAEHAPFLIQGNEGQAVQLATCCSPIPGDPLIAMIRRAKGMLVHTQDCPTARKQREREPERWVKVNWDDNYCKHLHTRIEVIAEQGKGVLGAILMQISAADSNVIHVQTRENDGDVLVRAVILTIEVTNRQHLAKVFRAIRKVKQVKRVQRIRT